MITANILPHILLLVITAGAFSSPVSDCDVTSVEQQIADLVTKTFGSQGHIPLNVDELNHDCILAYSLVTKIVEIVKPCIPDDMQQYLPVALQGVNDFISEICTSGGDFQNLYLKEAGCFNDHMSEAGPCVQQVAKELLPIIQNPDATQFCCSVNQFDFCMGEVAEKTCGVDAKTFMKKTFKLIEGVLFPMICAQEDCSGWLTDAPPSA